MDNVTNNNNELNNNANELNNPVTPDLTTIEGIQQAISECKDIVMKGVLATLLATKQKEVELAAKLAAKPAASGKKLSTDEAVIKSLFVAVRPHVQSNAPEDTALKSFKAAVAAITDNFSNDLQVRIFATSTVHCLKSNFNKKNNDISESYISYLETVRQAKLLLPKVTEEQWNAWLVAVQEAAKRAAKKRGISWTVPTVQPETVQPETVQPETVQPETVQPETVQPETVQPDKKTIITTRSNRGKRK